MYKHECLCSDLSAILVFPYKKYFLLRCGKDSIVLDFAIRVLCRVAILTQVWLQKVLWKGGHVWWLTPVIPALWKAEAGCSLDSSSRPAWATWSNPVSTKSTKISWPWCETPTVPATHRAEVGDHLSPWDSGCSERWSTTALQPERQSETLSQKNVIKSNKFDYKHSSEHV